MSHRTINNLLPTPASGGTPAIDYTYDDGAVSGAAKYLRRTSVTYPSPSTRRAIYYNYPSSGDGSVLSRLDNIADSGAGTTKYVQYGYLGASAISKLAHPSVTYGLDLTYDPSANGTFTNLDQFGQITKQSWNVAGGDADPFTYGYDYNGNRTYRGDTGFPADQLYTYDTLDRLIDMQQGTLNSTNTGFTGTVAKEEQFTLDELGNWPEYLTKASGTTNLDQTRAHTAANETGTITHVTGATWVSPTYDLAGNMVSGPKPASPTTNLKFIYDGWNRMVQVQDNSSTIIATYRYDGQNHRIQKLLGSNPSSPTSYYDYYYNENWQVLEERLNGSGTSLNAQYIWDIRYIDAPVVRFDGSTAIYYCEDANMNVTSLTDHFGLVVERYTYDSYGQIHFFGSDLGTNATSSANGNEILFGGYRYDPETGLYHVRNRMYHPTLGKWGSRDPKQYVDGMSIYQFDNSSPINYLDNYGTQTQPAATQPIDNGNITKIGYGEKKPNVTEFENNFIWGIELKANFANQWLIQKNVWKFTLTNADGIEFTLERKWWDVSHLPNGDSPTWNDVQAGGTSEVKNGIQTWLGGHIASFACKYRIEQTTEVTVFSKGVEAIVDGNPVPYDKKKFGSPNSPADDTKKIITLTVLTPAMDGPAKMNPIKAEDAGFTDINGVGTPSPILSFKWSITGEFDGKMNVTSATFNGMQWKGISAKDANDMNQQAKKIK